MATLTFDKLAYVDRLTAVGMDESQARALAEGLDQALREEVATKADVAAVRSDLAAVRNELVAAVRSEVAAVRSELKADTAAVRLEMQAAKHDVLRWIVGMAFAQVGLTVALIRFLPH